MRDLDAAQVVELVRLAESRVARRRGGALDQRQPSWPNGLVDRRAARGRLFWRAVGREQGKARLSARHCGERDQDEGRTDQAAQHRTLLVCGEDSGIQAPGRCTWVSLRWGH